MKEPRQEHEVGPPAKPEKVEAEAKGKSGAPKSRLVCKGSQENAIKGCPGVSGSVQVFRDKEQK